MKTKKSFVLLSFALMSTLILGGCNTKKNDSQSGGDQSSIVGEACTVRFLVDGEVILTKQVTKGEKVTFDGKVADKETDDPNVISRFRKWDKNIDQAISKDTDFNAVMVDYAKETIIDNFESYTSNGRLLEAKWAALGYKDGGWTEDTKAAVSLGQNATQGEKSLKFDAWTNGVGYKFAKTYDECPFTLSANALKFNLMIPSACTFRVLIYTEPVVIEGKTYSPYFRYEVDITSGEYVEYLIPLADDNWELWGEAGKSIASVADWVGIHQDDINQYINKIEFYAEAPVIANGSPYSAFFDDFKFVTLDEPEFTAKEDIKLYKTYTAETTVNHQKVRLTLEDNGTGKIYLPDLLGLTYNGIYEMTGKQITFKSRISGEEDGETLIYTGVFTDGGQHLKYLSSSGSMGDEVVDMDAHAVQVLDDFESYTEDGVAWWNGNKDHPEQRSGCRGSYYSEYYSGDANDSTNWGGSKWSLLRGDGDQLQMVTDAESGNHYLSLKNSTGAAMRYMPWGMYDGSSEKMAYRGAKFSFWARNTGAPLGSFKVYAYSQNAPRNATKDERCRVGDFAQTEVINDWTHFEIDINPDLVYYGFVIFMDWNRVGAATLFVDNIEIYAVSPYKTVQQ